LAFVTGLARVESALVIRLAPKLGV